MRRKFTHIVTLTTMFSLSLALAQAQESGTPATVLSGRTIHAIGYAI